MTNINLTPILPEGWARARGHAHAVVSKGSRIIHISGHTGRPEGAPSDTPMGTIAEQFDSSLEKIVHLMKSAGGAVENITMVRIYCSDVKGYRAAGAAIGAAYTKHMGKHFPSMMFVGVTELLNAQAKIEIDAEGILP
jgi:enamine deaminase RidA (YjgF/YER057c/UK114 family)